MVACWCDAAQAVKMLMLQLLCLTPNEPVPAPHCMLLMMSGVHLAGAPGSCAKTPVATPLHNSNSSGTTSACAMAASVLFYDGIILLCCC